MFSFTGTRHDPDRKSLSRQYRRLAARGLIVVTTFFALLAGVTVNAAQDATERDLLLDTVAGACPREWTPLTTPFLAGNLTIVDPWRGVATDRDGFLGYLAGELSEEGLFDADRETLAADVMVVIAECAHQKTRLARAIAESDSRLAVASALPEPGEVDVTIFPDGLALSSAAGSCEAILAAWPDSPNGEYWIDDDGAGGVEPIQRFCQMVEYPDGTAAEQAGLSCKSIKDAYPGSTSGAYWLDVNGGGTEDAFRAWCDMDSAGGGWTLVAAQFEADPLTDWGEGIQADYDPSLASRRSFTLSGAELPAHAETAFGRDLEATYVDYADFVYSTGNLDKRLLFGKRRGVSYHVHRDVGYGYAYGNPEEGSSTSESVRNRFTFDEVGGRQYTWCYTPNYSQSLRGYTLFGYRGWYTDDFAWTVWVR